jgi:protein tyrosine phosphatase (PTP) superfamily phosphohydrolase (DUF442 family)
MAAMSVDEMEVIETAAAARREGAPASRDPGSKGKRRTPLAIGLGIAAIAGGAVLWHKAVRDWIFPKNFGVVVDGAIYRSGQNSPRVLREMVGDLGIRTIIDLGGMSDAPETRAEREVAAELGVKRYEFGLSGDGTGDPDRWAAVERLLADDRNHPVLVHCAAGAQRTSTAVLLYRHLVEGAPITEAYPETFQYKHEPDEWILLAFLTDNLDAIKRSFETGDPCGDEAGESVDAFAEMFIVTEDGGR